MNQTDQTDQKNQSACLAAILVDNRVSVRLGSSTMTELSDLSPVPLSKAPRLSKSKFLSGLQCHKRLYLEIHHPSLATKPDAATQAMFDMGTEVGELARTRFARRDLRDARP